MLKSLTIKFLSFAGVLLSAAYLPQANSAQLVIIIDDIGNNYALGNAMVEIPAPLTLAFLPHTPFAKKLAIKAHSLNKEIMLHAPMENTVSAPLGPGALTQDLNENEFKATLRDAIQSIPYIQGINNHMGSSLTQNKEAMSWVMDTLSKEQLYFVDSLTSPKSVAFQQAQQKSLPALERNVFLDNDKSTSALEQQWQKAIKIANHRGSAILIGHPYQESQAFLAKKIPTLAAQGIELVPASRLLLQQAWQKFKQPEQTVSSRSNRYLLNKKNIRATTLNEEALLSQNSAISPH